MAVAYSGVYLLASKMARNNIEIHSPVFRYIEHIQNVSSLDINTSQVNRLILIRNHSINRIFNIHNPGFRWCLYELSKNRIFMKRQIH